MPVDAVTLSDISQRSYVMADQIEPTAMPKPGSIEVEQSAAADPGRGTLVDTYV